MTAEPGQDSRGETRSRAEAGLEKELPRHHQASFGWALSCCRGDEAEAADVLQDAYLKLLDGRARFEGRSSLRTFLFGVIRRTAQERRRRRRLRWAAAWAAGGDSRAGEDGEDPSHAVLRSEESARVTTALGRLSTRQRQVLHLVFYQNMTIEEAATVMGTSVGTARTHYERGKKRLRGMLAPGEPGP
jgi:RNA polymerase sigma-70 factor (ECF subfamily)